jgi:hypothetical protein
MLKKSRKYLLLLLLASVLLLVFFPGCGATTSAEEATSTTASITTTTSSTPASNLSQAQLQQIVTNSIHAVKSAGSYSYNMNMNMGMEITGGSTPGAIAASMNSTGTADVTAREMQMHFDMTVSEDTTSETEGFPQNISAEMYLMPEALYMKINIPVIGEQWVKMPVSDEVKNEFDLNIVDEQLNLLESSIELQFLGYETIDGSECYVIKVVPDLTKLMEWVNQQQVLGKELNPEEITDIPDVFKELDYTIWISRDSKLTKKIIANVLIDVDAGQLGTTQSDFDEMTVNIDLEMLMYNYNETVSIVLPDEAQNAIEIPTGTSSSIIK